MRKRCVFHETALLSSQQNRRGAAVIPVRPAFEVPKSAEFGLPATELKIKRDPAKRRSIDAGKTSPR